MKEITFKINGLEVKAKQGEKILQVARRNGFDIPTLCYLKDINEIGACRMCLVEIKGSPTLQASCVYPVEEGLEVLTNSPRVRRARRVNLELILSNHNRECTTCVRSGNCELQTLSNDLGIDNIPFQGEYSADHVDSLSPSIVRDETKCILCKRCVAVCSTVQGMGVLGAVGRGFTSKVQPVFGKSINNVNCINCGQCIINCPVGALKEKSNVQDVWDALADPEKVVYVQPAPAVRAVLGEEFGMKMGTPVTGKLAASLRRLGFDGIFDTDFGADVTIMEEGTELLSRIQNGGKLPLFTSCCPAWVKLMEMEYPDMLDHLSSCKSPQNMTGALLKPHYAPKNNVDPKKVVVVSVMPCTAKKFESAREELSVNGLQDVDITITTRELARMIKEARIDFLHLPDEDFDPYYGESTGAGALFGTTGGVMEAAVRTVADIVNQKDIQAIEYQAVRGVKDIKTADVKISDDLSIKVAVVHGGANIHTVMDAIKAGEYANYQFIEFMACPGGCVNGGGQTIVSARVKEEINICEERAKALYDVDQHKTYRKSHQNPSIIRIYDEFLSEPCGHQSHKLLHTTYAPKAKIK